MLYKDELWWIEYLSINNNNSKNDTDFTIFYPSTEYKYK